MDTPITQLARWITGSPLDQNSVATQRARVAVQDTVACMLAGSSKSVTQRVAQSIEGLGSGPCTTVSGASLAAPWAAMLNGTAAHALDFDDYDFPAASHPSAVLVPAAFALAEELGASGADVLDAYVVGYETMACIGKSVNMAHYERGWHSTATLGALGATAACARLMKLDTDNCASALSIATSLAAGFKAQFGTMTKPLHAGLAAKNGVLIVEFANQLRDRGTEFSEAIIKASAIRLRPVLMTSLCTAFGAIPFLLASGAGAEQRLPVGIVVFYGTIISVFLTLLVVPAVYSLVARRTKPSSHMSQLVDRLLGARDQNSGLGRA